MRNTMYLIKANFINSFGINKLLKVKTGREKLKILGIIAAILYGYGTLVTLIFLYMNNLANALDMMNSLVFLCVIAFTGSTVMILIISIYKSTSHLFAFKDYDLLMALPVKPREILASKIFFFYATNYLSVLSLSIPPIVILGIKQSLGIPYFILAIAMSFLIPLLPMTIGSLIGLLIGFISSKFRKSNLLMITISFIFLLGFIAGMQYLNSLDQSQVLANATMILQQVTDKVFPAKWFIQGAVELHLPSLLGFIGLEIIPFVAFLLFFEKSFAKINSRLSERFNASNYKMKSLQVSHPVVALYKKEMKMYFSSYIYVLNTGIGAALMTVMTIAIAILGKDVISQVLAMEIPDAFITPAIIVLLVFLVVISPTTASTISMEGKQLWIIQSLPINVLDIFMSKMMVNLSIFVPSIIFNGLILGIILRLSLLSLILIILIPLFYTTLISMIGLLINLCFPIFDWKSPTTAVKQSLSVILTMIIGMTITAVPIVLFILMKPANILLFEGIGLLGLIIVNLILFYLLKTKGVRLFKELNN